MDDVPRTGSKYFLRRSAIAALLVLAIGGAGVWSDWDQIAVMLAPKKVAAVSRSQAALAADELFWQTFHDGQYDQIERALEVLTAAYLQTPDDAITAAHVAWVHTWRISEMARVESPPATITDDTIVARNYFHQAVMLDPSDARYLGFLAGMTMAEGNIQKDDRLTREGYFLLLKSIRAWPEFNLFTGGYILSRLPADSPQFTEGLEWQWETLCDCTSDSIDRADPDYAKYMPLETTTGQKRVCWNSWIAPHNFEGFFLNMGDMLVKAGQWQTAQTIYANAKLSGTYDTWKFGGVLADRIEQAEANVAVFNDADPTSKPHMMIRSEFACMACHQN